MLYTWEGGAFRAASWDEMRSAAHHAAGSIATALGNTPGRVGCLLTNDFACVSALVGGWLANAAVVSLPLIPRGSSPALYRALLAKICAQADLDLIVTAGQYAAGFEEFDLGVPIVAAETLLAGPYADGTSRGADDVIFIQYSSGSTSDPKGCMLTAGAIGAHSRRVAEILEADGVGGSWLPLSHDMGCLGSFLLTWHRGVPLVMSRPERFLKSPRTWFDDCAEFGVTITAAPNFALELAARAALIAPPPKRLQLKSVILGGERNEWSTYERVTAALAGSGLSMRSLTPAYGLAEATLAVTMKPFGTEARSVAGDVDGLHATTAEDRPDRRLVSCGVPLRDVAVSCGAAGEVSPIQIEGPTLASGYLNDGAATERTFRDGTLHTEDLGLVVDGELFVIGRRDDVIVVGGRNVHARDIEVRLTPEIGVRAGLAAVIALDDGPKQRLVAIAEPTKGASDLRKVARNIARVAQETSGVAITRCLFVDPGVLPKTPSGKVRRGHCRELALADAGEWAACTRA